jgi:hypothetical protein
MYVPTMNSDEMYAEFDKDYGELIYTLWYKIFPSKRIKAMRREGQRFPAKLIFEHKTERNNTYLIDITFPTRKSVFVQHPGKLVSGYTAVISTNSGNMAIMFDQSGTVKSVDDEGNVESEKVRIITQIMPHAFIRYKERKELDVDGIDIIKDFLKSNYDFQIRPRYHGTDNNEICVICKDGGIFGEIEFAENTYKVIAKTFISNDTMQEGYKSEFNKDYNDFVDKNSESVTDKNLKKVLELNKRK